MYIYIYIYIYYIYRKLYRPFTADAGKVMLKFVVSAFWRKNKKRWFKHHWEGTIETIQSDMWGFWQQNLHTNGNPIVTGEQATSPSMSVLINGCFHTYQASSFTCKCLILSKKLDGLPEGSMSPKEASGCLCRACDEIPLCTISVPQAEGGRVLPAERKEGKRQKGFVQISKKAQEAWK